MSLLHAFPFEYRGDESGGERVAGAYGVGNLDFRSRLEGDIPRSEHIAAVDAVGEDDHF